LIIVIQLEVDPMGLAPNPMKMLKKYLMSAFFILSCALVLAAHKKTYRDSASVIITFNNQSNQDKPLDSVLVIFDKCDLSGAGIVRQVFYPVGNRIAVVIPKGRYFVDVYCLQGPQKEHFGTILHTRGKRNNKLLFKLRETAFFTPGMVSFPEERIDFANLSITRSFTYK
jgi:hypothetical protein